MVKTGMTKVKICGIKCKKHALAAAEAGADFVGLVFAPSKRQIDTAQAREIVDVVKGCITTPLLVGVFVNTKASEVNEIADFCGLDWVQLSGDESWEYCREINRPIIKAVRVGEHKGSREIISELEAGIGQLGEKRYLLLLDSEVKDKYGGTGMAFDWRLAHAVAERFPVIVAGGLTPENVAEAIKTVSPWGVDVSSGVEVEGTKDVAKIKAFIAAVRSIEETLNPEHEILNVKELEL